MEFVLYVICLCAILAFLGSTIAINKFDKKFKKELEEQNREILKEKNNE